MKALIVNLTLVLSSLTFAASLDTAIDTNNTLVETVQFSAVYKGQPIAAYFGSEKNRLSQVELNSVIEKRANLVCESAGHKRADSVRTVVQEHPVNIFSEEFYLLPFNSINEQDYRRSGYVKLNSTFAAFKAGGMQYGAIFKDHGGLFITISCVK